LARTAKSRRASTESKIVDRLVGLIAQERDPVQGSVLSLVTGAGISRATYFRHRESWTWDYLIGDLLAAKEPAAAAKLEWMRGALPNRLSLAPVFLPSGTREAHAQDLRFILDGLTASARRDPVAFLADPTIYAPDGTAAPPEDQMSLVTFYWVAGLRWMRIKAEQADDGGDESWSAIAAVAARTAETLRFCRDAADADFGEPLTEAGEFGREWAYVLVRSSVSPEAAVRRVAEGTWRRRGPGFEARLWVQAATATLDRHSIVRRHVVRSETATRDLDEQALSTAVRCLRRAMENRPPRKREDIFRALVTADLLAAADMHAFSRTHPLLDPDRVRLADYVRSRPFDCSSSEATGRRAAAISVLVDPSRPDDPTRGLRALRRYVGTILGRVGQSDDGVSSLCHVPPRAVTVLVDTLLADSGPTSVQPGQERVARHLLEQLRLASTTSEWQQLPLSARREWESLLRRHRSHLHPELAPNAVRSIQRSVGRLEQLLARQTRVSDKNYRVLMEAAACLRSQLERIDGGRRVSPSGDASSAPGYRLTSG